MLKLHYKLVEPKQFRFSIDDKIGSANHNTLRGGVNTALTISFGNAGTGLHTDLTNAEVLGFRIGQLAVSGSEGSLARTVMTSPIYSTLLYELLHA